MKEKREGSIETEADELIELVDEKRKISASKTARILGVRKRQIEEWADFLEKKGKINLKMWLFGFDLISKDLRSKK
jgi:predicted transcriptional regulator of viral defense system